MKRLLSALLPLVGVGCAGSTPSPVTSSGSLADVDLYVRALFNTAGYSTLVIEAPGPDAFVQFSAADGEVQMDFPLITAAQKEREAQIRQLCEDHRLEVHENLGSDGARFLDCRLRVDPTAAAQVVGSFLRTIYAVEPSTRLTFHSVGLELG